MSLSVSAIQRPSRVALILTLLLAILLACTDRGGELVEFITLTFACHRSDLSVYQDAAETFHQSNPSIDVRIIPLDEILSLPLEDETDTLGPVRQLASRADAFLWSVSGVVGGPAGLVLDLAPFVEAGGAPTEADFLTGLLAHFQWQGGTWGLPTGVDPLFVLYDPMAFDAAGLETPSPGWTWDDLFDAAKQLTQREGEQVVRYGFADFGLESVRSAIEAQGGRLVDDSAEPPVPALDDPRTVAAVRWYADLVLTHGVMPNPAGERFVDTFDLVRRGETAMCVSLAQMWDSGCDEELGVAPLPGGSPVWLYGYFISAGTAHAEAAWRWLRFLSSEVAPPHRLPARRSLIPDSAYATAVGVEALEVFRYAAEHALPPVRPAVEILLRQAVERVFEGEEVEGVLAEAQEQALSLLAPGVTKPLTVPSPPPVQATVETITFVALGVAFGDRPYIPLAEAFHEAHPEIEVVVREATDFDYYGGAPAELIATSSADCFMEFLWLPGEVRQAVLNLQPFIDADPTFLLDDYIPWALEWMRYGGDLWGLPAGVSVEVLWYDRTLFDEAGLPYPKDDWSWDDVLLTARSLSGAKEGSRRYGFIIWPGSRVVSLLRAVGGPLVDESAVPPSFRFDAPEVVAAARRLADLVQSEVVPGPDQPVFELIVADRVGMWGGPARWWDKSSDFRPVPLPKPSRCWGLRSFLAYYVAADTPHAEACWEWLRFLSDRIPNTDRLPPRRSLLTSDDFREQVGADAQAAYLEALECEDQGGLRGMESLPPYSSRAVYPWLEQALGEILWHGAGAQATLSEAQIKAEAYLHCLRQRPDLEDKASADACFQVVDAP